MVNYLFQFFQPINIAVKLRQEVVLLRDITGCFAHIFLSLLYKLHKDILPIANTVLDSVWDGWIDA